MRQNNCRWLLSYSFDSIYSKNDRPRPPDPLDLLISKELNQQQNNRRNHYRRFSGYSLGDIFVAMDQRHKELQLSQQVLLLPVSEGQKECCHKYLAAMEDQRTMEACVEDRW